MDRRQIRNLAIFMLIPFSALTAWAVYEYGLTGIFANQLTTSAGIQVLVDLVIAMILFLIWMFPDARKSGRNPWPYVVITLLAGCFGPLLYLALTKVESPTANPA
ncbi:MAG: DUF2834 domain-containing protein [Pseudomonadota bacterium]